MKSKEVQHISQWSISCWYNSLWTKLMDWKISLIAKLMCDGSFFVFHWSDCASFSKISIYYYTSLDRTLVFSNITTPNITGTFPDPSFWWYLFCFKSIPPSVMAAFHFLPLSVLPVLIVLPELISFTCAPSALQPPELLYTYSPSPHLIGLYLRSVFSVQPLFDPFVFGLKHDVPF